MSEEQPERARVRWWIWPGQWLRSESWWREVSTRVAAALMSAGVIWFLAVAAGYLRAPESRSLLTYTLVALICLALGALAWWGAGLLAVRLVSSARDAGHIKWSNEISAPLYALLLGLFVLPAVAITVIIATWLPVLWLVRQVIG